MDERRHVVAVFVYIFFSAPTEWLSFRLQLQDPTPNPEPETERLSPFFTAGKRATTFLVHYIKENASKLTLRKLLN